MRDLKFRAWYGINREMKDLRVFDLDAVDARGLAIMQYTGLKDKNGVEIYEGDIVEFKLYKSTRRDVIEWENIAKHTSFGAGTHNVTVIGNIYESPDLLEKAS